MFDTAKYQQTYERCQLQALRGSRQQDVDVPQHKAKVSTIQMPHPRQTSTNYTQRGIILMLPPTL
jgi:hypothetical protein